MRIQKLQEEWEPVDKASVGDAAVPMALLDPLLDAIQGQLDARAADVEWEMAANVRRPMRLSPVATGKRWTSQSCARPTPVSSRAVW